MSDILYIHGFLSSPSSKKASLTQDWLAANHPQIRYHCPALSSYPEQAWNTLCECIQQCQDKPAVIGSSLGGFWASCLIEQDLATRAVLINPAISPHQLFTDYVGQTLQSYYSEECYSLKQSDLEYLQQAESQSLKDASRYWLLVQTGDEVLDYRLATRRYQAAKKTIETGGDHSFIHYDRWLPEILEFLI